GRALFRSCFPGRSGSLFGPAAPLLGGGSLSGGGGGFGLGGLGSSLRRGSPCGLCPGRLRSLLGAAGAALGLGLRNFGSGLGRLFGSGRRLGGRSCSFGLESL